MSALRRDCREVLFLQLLGLVTDIEGFVCLGSEERHRAHGQTGRYRRQICESAVLQRLLRGVFPDAQNRRISLIGDMKEALGVQESAPPHRDPAGTDTQAFQRPGKFCLVMAAASFLKILYQRDLCAGPDQWFTGVSLP